MTTTRRPRIHYSEKALRQMKGAPARDCGTHPDTYYVRVPEPLRERVGHDWSCEECLKVLKAEMMEMQRRDISARAADRTARKAARTQAKARAAEHLDILVVAVDKGLGEVKAIQEEHARTVEDRYVAMAEVTAATAAVAKAEAALLTARQHLAQEKRRLADAKARVEAPIDHAGFVDRMHFEADLVETALASFDVAIDAVNGSARKKLLGKNGGRATMKNAARIIRVAREWNP